MKWFIAWWRSGWDCPLFEPYPALLWCYRFYLLLPALMFVGLICMLVFA